MTTFLIEAWYRHRLGPRLPMGARAVAGTIASTGPAIPIFRWRVFNSEY